MTRLTDEQVRELRERAVAYRGEYPHEDAPLMGSECIALADECLARGEREDLALCDSIAAQEAESRARTDLATARGLLERAAEALHPTSMLREDIAIFLAGPPPETR